MRTFSLYIDINSYRITSYLCIVFSASNYRCLLYSIPFRHITHYTIRVYFPHTSLTIKLRFHCNIVISLPFYTHRTQNNQYTYYQPINPPYPQPQNVINRAKQAFQETAISQYSPYVYFSPIKVLSPSHVFIREYTYFKVIIL